MIILQNIRNARAEWYPDHKKQSKHKAVSRFGCLVDWLYLVVWVGWVDLVVWWVWWVAGVAVTDINGRPQFPIGPKLPTHPLPPPQYYTQIEWPPEGSLGLLKIGFVRFVQCALVLAQGGSSTGQWNNCLGEVLEMSCFMVRFRHFKEAIMI